MRSLGAPLSTAAVAALILLALWRLGPRPVRELWHWQQLAAGDPLARSVWAGPALVPAWPESDGSPERLLPPGVAARGVFFDADNDGDIDVVARASPDGRGGGPLDFFLRGPAGYRDVSATIGEPFTVDLPAGLLRAGDFDADGRLDLAVERVDGGAPVVLWNRFQSRAWLDLELVPSGGEPRSGSLRVGLPVGDRLRWHRVTLPSGGRGRCVAHVGLGDLPAESGSVRQATVVWPDAAPVIAAVTVGAATRIVEGGEGAPGGASPGPAVRGESPVAGDR